jgi:hypothetical protein
VCRDDNLEVIRRWCSNNASGVGGLWRGLKQTVKRWR